MDVAISVIRPFHVVQMANILRKHADNVGIWSSAPRKTFRRLDSAVSTHFVPSPVEIVSHQLRRQFASVVHERGAQFWDGLVGALLPKSELVIAFATQALGTARVTHNRGGYFALDRACPHVDFQEELVRQESEATGAKFIPQPAWFRERQLEEYEIADAILVPSHYSGDTFPAHQQSKLVLAPLLGRASVHGEMHIERNTPFTVGVLGGNPLRKGYRFLLEAWNRLRLPNARLQIRSSADFSQYPKLAELLRTTPNVEILDYIPDISEFYRRCDLFVLPSMDDGFGMALFEAMANGVPSIATRNCGASEFLIDGEDGLIVDAGSTDQLAAAIASLYENEERRQALAIAGRATVERISAASTYENALLELLTRVHTHKTS